MPRFEYRVVPAPTKATRVKGVKGTDARFAAALARLMNELGADGWEYQRSDTLPCEERQGLTGRTTTFKNVLVFRRALEPETVAVAAPEPLPAERSQPVLAAPLFHTTAQPAAVPPPTQAAPDPQAAALSAAAPEGVAPALTAGEPPAPAEARVAPVGPAASAPANAPAAPSAGDARG